MEKSLMIGPTLFAIAIALTIASGASAQSPTNGATPQASEHLSLARRLVRLMQIVGTTSIDSHPLPPDPNRRTTAFDRETVRTSARWMGRYLPRDTIVEINARALAHEFSDAELRELLVFYQSPVGRRFADAQVVLLRNVAAETNRILAPHRTELRDSLRKVAARIDSL